NFLLPLHELYHFREDNTAIEQIGFLHDRERQKEVVKKYVEWDEKIRYELFKITGTYLNTGSPKQVSELLYDRYKIPARRGTSEEVLTTIYNTTKNPLYQRVVEL